MKYKKITQICSAVLVATGLASVPMMTTQSNIKADVTKEDTKGPNDPDLDPKGGMVRACYYVKTDTTHFRLPFDKYRTVGTNPSFSSWTTLKISGDLPSDYEYSSHPEYVYHKKSSGVFYDQTFFNYTISRKYSTKPDKNNTKRSVNLKYVDSSGNVIKRQTLTGVQGQTIQIHYQLPEGWDFDSSKTDPLFVTMPDGKFTFATHNEDITIPLVRPDQSTSRKHRVEMTVHYVDKNRKELDRQTIYGDANTEMCVPLKYAPTDIDTGDTNIAAHSPLLDYDDWVDNVDYYEVEALAPFVVPSKLSKMHDIYLILKHQELATPSKKVQEQIKNGTSKPVNKPQESTHKEVKQIVPLYDGKPVNVNANYGKTKLSHLIEAKANQGQTELSHLIEAKANQGQTPTQKTMDNKQNTSSNQSNAPVNNTPQNNASSSSNTQAPTSSAKSDSTKSSSDQPDNTHSNVNSALTHSDNTKDDTTPDDSNQTPDDVQNTANPKEGKIEVPAKSLKKSDSSVAPSKDKKIQKVQSVSSSAPSTKPAEKVVTPNQVIKNKVLPQTGELNIVLPAILTGLGSLIALISLLFKHQKNN